MSEAVKSEQVEITNRIPEGLDFPERNAALEAGITIVNDTERPVVALISNGFLGPAGSGYILPGQALKVPTSWAWWDVWVLFQYHPSGIQIRWRAGHAFTAYYHRKKIMVGWQDTVKVSEMQA